MRWLPVAGSLAVNAALLALLAGLAHRRAVAPPIEPVEITLVEVAPPATAPVPDRTGEGGGAAGGDGATTTSAAAPRPDVATGDRPAKPRPRAARVAAPRPDAPGVPPGAPATTSPWADVTIGMDDGAVASGEAGDDGEAGGDRGGGGTGAGHRRGIGLGDGGTGAGHGRGIGLGDGGRVDPIAHVPVPTEPSRAQPARLLHPTRETEVEADELFIARVTVDEDGDVVGARMVRTHPGSRGDTAASMIWQFRYAPALDDLGKPVRSTFEQTFAVR